MLTTAKSIQLLDASGMNISPITDITSLYYEVANSSNSSIISRKYVYTGFPVAVNITGEATSQIGVSINTSEKRHPDDGSLYDNGQFYKIIDKDRNDDLLISRVDTNIIPGTTYRQINVTNYNLSEILSYYTPLDLIDASCHILDISIDNINSSISDISNRISNLRKSIDASICSFEDIKQWKALVPNKFYLINNYYVGNGCMAVPNSDFTGPSGTLSLLVKANDASTLDGKLYEMYDHSGNALKVYGTYKIENDKVRITYMKDQYGNEAPYDFYNLIYEQKYTFGTNSIDSSIQNNIIKTDPYTFGSMVRILNNNSSYIIKNNYIGYDVSLYIEIPENGEIINNIIGNNNIIEIKTDHQQENNDLNISNCKICNFNIINIDTKQSYPILFKNVIVNSNNNISSGISDLSLVIINSSNNITLYNNASNITILNNCNGSINLSDNIIVDNYIDTVNSSLNTSSNSVYLFGQNVYAKSFNTLK